jgi:hypothetical protein
MGRPRKPAKVLELSGAFDKNPARKRARASELKIGTPLGPAPKEWVEKAANSQRCADLLDAWHQVIAQDALGVLNSSHRLLVESTCYLIYKIRQASKGYGKATSGDFAQLKSNMAAMGQTPADSAKVAEAVRIPDRGGSSGGARSRPGGWGEYVG